MRVFLDTNVLVDVLLSARRSHNASKEVIRAAEAGKVELLVTGLSLVNADYILSRSPVARTVINRFVQLVLALCETASIDRNQLQAALDSGWHDFEDAVQYQAAISAGRIKAIITNDRTGFKGSRIPVLTPEAFVAEHL